MVSLSIIHNFTTIAGAMWGKKLLSASPQNFPLRHEIKQATFSPPGWALLLFFVRRGGGRVQLQRCLSSCRPKV